MAEGVAKILTSQYKIYLSYPAEAVHKNQIVAWDKRIKKEFPDIYHSVTNRAVKMRGIVGMDCIVWRRIYAGRHTDATREWR